MKRENLLKLKRCWYNLRQRCCNPNHPEYPRYGGRGIRVRWSKFSGFMREVGLPPDGLSIDRINNDGNYEQGNLRWATAKMQAQNRRGCRKDNWEQLELL